ncbi:hypothetical protein REPUB_Repub11eG0197500 [Reevesia pubescens]
MAWSKVLNVAVVAVLVFVLVAAPNYVGSTITCEQVIKLADPVYHLRALWRPMLHPIPRRIMGLNATALKKVLQKSLDSTTTVLTSCLVNVEWNCMPPQSDDRVNELAELS